MFTKKLQSAHPLWLGVFVSLCATIASYLLPEEHAASGVGLVFLLATYVFALPLSAERPPAHFGLALGGLMEPGRLSPLRMIKETTVAFARGTLVAALLLLPFSLGFVLWYEPPGTFDWSRALSGPEGTGLFSFVTVTVAWHFLGVALPEEAFFRGYLQTALSDRHNAGWSVRERTYTFAIVVVSVLFAAGHYATSPHPARLAVFFPSLLFGVMRTATGGIGACVVLHAECNLMSHVLSQGYAL